MQFFLFPHTDLNQQNQDWVVNKIKELEFRVANGGIKVVTLASQMTDPAVIYIYNGTEAGMTNGDWYYYDTLSQAWVDGGSWGGTHIDLPLAVNEGGTGADNAADARQNLGINPANIGAVPASALPLSIANGGTAATSAKNAAKNIKVPSMGEAPDALPTGADLDDYTTVGSYSVKNDTIALSLYNYPSNTAGVIRVYNSAGDSKVYGDSWLYLIQEVADVQGRIWRRSGTSGGGTTVTWNNWFEYMLLGKAIVSQDISYSVTVPANGSYSVTALNPPTGYEYLSCAVTNSSWEVVPHVVMFNSVPTLVLANASTSSKSDTLTGKIYYIKS